MLQVSDNSSRAVGVLCGPDETSVRRPAAGAFALSDGLGVGILGLRLHQCRAVPPDTAFRTQVTVEPDLQDSIQGHARQWTLGISRDDVRSGGRGPDLEQFLGGDLVRDMPMREAAARGGCEDVIGDVDIGLQLDALPVLCKLFVSALLSERCVAVHPVLREKGTKLRVVTRFPRGLIASHELLDIHWYLSPFFDA